MTATSTVLDRALRFVSDRITARIHAEHLVKHSDLPRSTACRSCS